MIYSLLQMLITKLITSNSHDSLGLWWYVNVTKKHGTRLPFQQCEPIFHWPLISKYYSSPAAYNVLTWYWQQLKTAHCLFIMQLENSNKKSKANNYTNSCIIRTRCNDIVVKWVPLDISNWSSVATHFGCTTYNTTSLQKFILQVTPSNILFRTCYITFK
jgi:hypothetical protein